MRELLARVKAMLRRARIGQEGSAATAKPAGPIESGNLLIDASRHEAQLDSEVLELKPKEYDLLSFLIANQGQAFSRDALLERVWGWEFTGGSRTVDVHVRWLRSKIEPEPSDPQRIVTVRGVGYRFEG
jgi:DNA-binding response OmpR family regulator